MDGLAFRFTATFCRRTWVLIALAILLTPASALACFVGGDATDYSWSSNGAFSLTWDENNYGGLTDVYGFAFNSAGQVTFAQHYTLPGSGGSYSQGFNVPLGVDVSGGTEIDVDMTRYGSNTGYGTGSSRSPSACNNPAGGD
jgi:hypothetical protein